MGYAFFLIFVCIVWGTQAPALKVAGADLPPLALNAIRFGLALLIIAPLAFRKGRKHPKHTKDLLLLALAGFSGIGAYGVLFMEGIERTTAMNSVILLNTHPFFTAIIAPFFTDERLTKTKFFALLIGFVGVLLAMTKGSIGSLVPSENLVGDLLVLCSAPCMSIFTVTMKRCSSYGAIVCNFYAMIFGVTGLCIASFFLESSHNYSLVPLTTWLLLLHIGLLTTGVFWTVWVDAIRRIGAIAIGNYIFIIPVSGIIMSSLLLGEQFHISVLLGASLILVGVYLVQKE